VTNAEEMDRVLINIHCVDDPVIADAQPAAIRAFQTVMRESSETSSHLVDPGFNSRPDVRWKFDERFVEASVENLEGAHRALSLAGPGLDVLGLFLLGLCKRRFEFGCELEFIFQEVIEGTPKLGKLRFGKMMQLRFDLLDLAHGSNSAPNAIGFKGERRKAESGGRKGAEDGGWFRSEDSG
jgi:hypothetical protein